MIPPIDHIIGPLFGGGPMDLSLLQSYMDQPIEELKLVSHGGNLMDYLTQAMVKGYINRSGLKPLYDERHGLHQGRDQRSIEAWVFEHLSTIPASENVLENDRKKPFAAKWLALRDTNKMIDVVWSPYASCRDLKPFEDQTLYSGYIVVGTFMWSYLPKRVLRQFEYVQRIPLDPPKRPIAYEKYCDTWAKWD
ncbi:hypothetical protein GmHk_13G037454 [Glycine max]|nr:hypothetical protein GmHk_13G037454 [Glycine max]